jgi:hypothetical protein
MSGAPNVVEERQLREAHIRVIPLPAKTPTV